MNHVIEQWLCCMPSSCFPWKSQILLHIACPRGRSGCQQDSTNICCFLFNLTWFWSNLFVLIKIMHFVKLQFAFNMLDMCYMLMNSLWLSCNLQNHWAGYATPQAGSFSSALSRCFEFDWPSLIWKNSSKRCISSCYLVSSPYRHSRFFAPVMMNPGCARPQKKKQAKHIHSCMTSNITLCLNDCFLPSIQDQLVWNKYRSLQNPVFQKDLTCFRGTVTM